MSTLHMCCHLLVQKIPASHTFISHDLIYKQIELEAQSCELNSQAMVTVYLEEGNT